MTIWYFIITRASHTNAAKIMNIQKVKIIFVVLLFLLLILLN